MESKKDTQLATIWEAPDQLWTYVEHVLTELDPPKVEGRPRADQRAILNGIIFRLRSGCQWNLLPKQFGDDSTIHRTFQKWIALGVWARIWGLLVEDCADLGAVDWDWQAADTALGKARLGGTRLDRIPPTGPRPGPNAVFLSRDRADP